MTLILFSSSAEESKKPDRSSPANLSRFAQLYRFANIAEAYRVSQGVSVTK